MDRYVPRESPEEAWRDRSRQVLLPAAVGAWIVGGVLLVLAAAGLVAVVLGGVWNAPLRIALHTAVALPADATTLHASDGSFVADSTSPVMTAAEVEVGGLSVPTSFALRTAPTVQLATAGIVAVMLGLVIHRVGSRVATSRLLLLAAVVLIGGSVLGQVLAFAGATGAGAIAWSGIPQVEHIVDQNTAAFDPEPFAVAVGLLIGYHLLRRLEGAGVLVPYTRPSRRRRAAPTA